MFKKLRIGFLLIILLLVSVDRCKAIHRTDWKSPLIVAVYPINGDGSTAAAAYIDALREGGFEVIEKFFAEEARRYGLRLVDPVEVLLGPAMKEVPPPPPRSGTLDTILWSLHFRWWAWWYSEKVRWRPHAKLFLVYVDPATHPLVDHSLGLREGMLGIANLYASRAQAGQNAVVLAHELLHTLGATDKYDPQSNYPRYPEGFAEPQADPRFPQRWAELMAGRIPLTQEHAEIPESLEHVLVGTYTAAEIGWYK